MGKKNTMAVIWDEPIYKNDFKCYCGQKVYDPSIPHKDCEHMFIRKGKDLFCPKCNTNIARLTWIPKADVTGKLMGDFDKYKEAKALKRLME